MVADHYVSPAVPAIIGTLHSAMQRTPVSTAPGVVLLTPAEAEFLRRTGFQTAAAGAWTVSPLPPGWVFGRYPALGPLVGLPAPCAAALPAEQQTALTRYRRI